MARTRILSFVGLIVTLAAAYGFERLIMDLRGQSGMSALVSGVQSSSLIVLAAMLMLLAWYVVSRAGRDVWVGVVFVVVGLVLTFLPALEWSRGPSNGPTNLWLTETLFVVTAGLAYLRIAVTFVAVIGVAALVAPKRCKGLACSP